MGFVVVKPGLLTTVQDLGRPGLQRQGIPVGGAMDRHALRVANLLVGNDEGAAGLELTLVGPTLTISGDALIAVCGADLAARLDGCELPLWRPVLARAGSTLAFGAAKSGCRAYVAVAGGVAVPPALGGRGTYMRAGLGGVDGRALAAGDRVPAGAPSGLARGCIAALRERAPSGSAPPGAAAWHAAPRAAAAAGPAVLRALPGSEHAAFAAASQAALFAADAAFTVSPASDRMGYRLIGGLALALAAPLEMASHAVTPGTVQVPPSGDPIVLMADCQTTGGYPKIAQVAAVDLPVLAQRKPGDRVAFRQISLEEAHRLYIAQEQELSLLKAAIKLKVTQMAEQATHGV